ncbi:hypothetical protein [Thalassospira marina]|uniref:hypothetical protein n=1 Tax=Thalassospira marina TaxID=2048283 RepID=UPI001056580C|nr:hypothetical protein [Thalassospira marina]
MSTETIMTAQLKLRGLKTWRGETAGSSAAGDLASRVDFPIAGHVVLSKRESGRLHDQCGRIPKRYFTGM